ncbi:MAG: undecaprenyl-diphosphate phosphatase [Planctomycetes bacterium]|nr:undecaprenyl-diphosphate phosphatase [Planctomycetota bacterium]
MDPTFSLSYFWAVALGLVQGLAEFLPISSSGHLALVEHLGMGMEAPLAFDVFLHLATLLVVLLYFYRSIVWYFQNDIKVLLYVLIATIPTAIVGLLGKRYFEALRQSPTMICIGLLVTACALSVAEIRRGSGYQLRDLGWFGSVVVGLCQSLALAPGVSRSGCTIAGAMICGVDRDEAFRFSFIISIPAVLGAVGLHGLELLRSGGWSSFTAQIQTGPYAVGFIVAALSGFFALRLLDRLVSSGRLVWFAGYCCLAAIAGLIYFNLLQ